MTEARGPSETRDPARGLALLWRHEVPLPPRRGPRPRLDVDDVVAAAVALADADGLAVVSVRAVARRLGTSTMSVYGYVPTKADLLDLMTDAVHAELPAGAPTRRRGVPAWRTRLEAVVRDLRALWARHPWLTGTATTRPPLGPHVIAWYERQLEAVDGIGLDDVEMDAVATQVLLLVQGTAALAAAAERTVQDTALSDAQWWAAHAPLLAAVFDADRYPLAARVGAAAGEAHQGAYSADHAFEFGLERLLDGVARLVDRE